MSIEIIDVEQGSPEWHQARLGITTASMFATVMRRNGSESKTRTKYMYQLAGEILTKKPAENYKNSYMQRGSDMEGEIRKHYAFLNSCDPQRVGFIKNGVMGCSPDSLIDSDGVLEIKSEAPHILIETLKRYDRERGAARVPSDHKAQCQGHLLVANRQYTDLVIGFTGMPKQFVARVDRDEAYLKELKDGIDVFAWELRKLVKELQEM